MPGRQHQIALYHGFHRSAMTRMDWFNGQTFRAEHMILSNDEAATIRIYIAHGLLWLYLPRVPEYLHRIRLRDGQALELAPFHPQVG